MIGQQRMFRRNQPLKMFEERANLRPTSETKVTRTFEDSINKAEAPTLDRFLLNLLSFRTSKVLSPW
jgi:hypothetical protein